MIGKMLLAQLMGAFRKHCSIEGALKRLLHNPSASASYTSYKLQQIFWLGHSGPPRHNCSTKLGKSTSS